MSQRRRLAVSLAAGTVVLAGLVWLTLDSTPAWSNLVPAVLFTVLIAFTTTFGVPLAGGRGSLLPMTTVAAYLVMGPVPTAWAVFLGAWIHGWVRYHWSEQLEEHLEPGLLAALGLAAANSTVQTISILAAGALFQRAGGTTPLTAVNGANLLSLGLLGLVYLGLNLLIAGVYMAARGRQVLQLYLHSLDNLFIYEGWPLVFSPTVALVYTRLGLGQFSSLALALVIASLVARNLSLAQRRLERRVKELASLQVVGQALSASLNLVTILEAIHTQVAGLMATRNFYVALYDQETDEVSFPLVIDDGQRIHWRSRRTGNGLTEYVVRTRAPLLIRDNYLATLEKLRIDQIGRLSACWLGVPLLAGEEPLGAIVVQSYSTPQAYDLSHQEILVTLAAQAAIAIQNAHLYARTDDALARRVQELDSILRTTREGILLLDPVFSVLAANRALADLLDVAQLELTGTTLCASRSEGPSSLMEMIGYEQQAWEADCQGLRHGTEDFKGKEIVVAGPPERYIARTLAPVRDREGAITGWLLVFRDISEERELLALREDLTDMLIHDLRSPVTVLSSSLEMLKTDLAARDLSSFDDLLALASQSSDRLLHLVNDLMDISRLESGHVAVYPEEIAVEPLLELVVDQLAPMARQAGITVEIESESDLPFLYADPELIDRVLHNLLDNALKFTPDGGQVRLWARIDAEADPAVMLLGVSDTGPGIPAKVQPRLFHKFEQVRVAKARRRGTGLGLPFCKLAVEAHSGEILIDSEVGKGSTFVVRLPLLHTLQSQSSRTTVANCSG
jgi:NtrC-family two-component system sensor histidine kinase KinB